MRCARKSESKIVEYLPHVSSEYLTNLVLLSLTVYGWSYFLAYGIPIVSVRY
jgi:hypothetical protein